MYFPRQLRIELSKRQLQDIYGNNIVYTGTNPLDLVATIGTEDTTWYDFTEYVDGLMDIDLEFSTDYLTETAQEGQLKPKKGTSGTLTFERNAYDFIKAHLVTSVSAALNEIEVRITDVNCGQYIGYIIKSRQLEWCEVNALCTYQLNLQQLDEYTHCIERTIISDNWRGWFQDEPLGGKKHPRFSYCIEQRPNWILVILWVLTAIVGTLYGVIYSVLYPILYIIYLLVLVINAIITVINAIIDAVNTLPGVSIPHIDPLPATPPPTPGDVFEAWSILMIESGGCGRETPAPLIRDYIQNVCNKCGVRVDASTADIFFAPYITLTHSDGVSRTEPNPHYNACYYFPNVERGVRRFRKLNLLSGNSDPNTTTYYQPANAPILSLDMFLDELKGVYNAQWRLIDEGGTPTLYFKRKDWFRDQTPLYDFSATGADRSKIVQGICYSFKDVKYPASCSELWVNDPTDKCGREAAWFYNGDKISFQQTVVNPLFKGILDKKSKFSSTKFNCDGASTNYLYDALQMCYNPFVSGWGLALVILNQLGTAIGRYADYSILQQTEQISMPKIVIWDGDTDNPGDPDYLNARAMRDKINIAGTVFTLGHTPVAATVPSIGLPDINTLYPSEVPGAPLTSTTPAALPWNTVHPAKTDVIGRISGATPSDGVYAVIDLFGSTVKQAAAILVNYPMYFEPHFKGTLWDWFHWIDDPMRYPRLNKDFEIKIPLCCEDVDKLKLVNTRNGMRLLYPVLLDTPFYNIGLITSIKAVYKTDMGDAESNIGQHIVIKGIV